MAESWRVALNTNGGQAGPGMLPNQSEWSSFADRSPGGTPREWAALLADVFADPNPERNVVKRDSLAAHDRHMLELD